MVAFAVGGLLGDTLFHLLPEIFLGEDEPEHVRFVMVEPNKNLLLGVAIMVGFVTFVAMDKGLRIATGGEDIHDHGHGHGHTHGKAGLAENTSTSAKVSGANIKGICDFFITLKLSTRGDGPAILLNAILNKLLRQIHRFRPFKKRTLRKWNPFSNSRKRNKC